MQTDVLISVSFIFFLSLMVGLILYWVGGRIGAKGEKSKDKLVPYACGEDLPPHKLQVDAERFLIYAVYFLIFDIFMVILATSLSTPGYFPAIYAFIVLMAVVLLLPLWRRK
jgi:NADH:ubiquinone oxidoreductase subunit 3 (subunit A)